MMHEKVIFQTIKLKDFHFQAANEKSVEVESTTEKEFETAKDYINNVETEDKDANNVLTEKAGKNISTRYFLLTYLPSICKLKMIISPSVRKLKSGYLEQSTNIFW